MHNHCWTVEASRGWQPIRTAREGRGGKEKKETEKKGGKRKKDEE